MPKQLRCCKNVVKPELTFMSAGECYFRSFSLGQQLWNQTLVQHFLDTIVLHTYLFLVSLASAPVVHCHRKLSSPQPSRLNSCSNPLITVWARSSILFSKLSDYRHHVLDCYAHHAFRSEGGCGCRRHVSLYSKKAEVSLSIIVSMFDVFLPFNG